MLPILLAASFANPLTAKTLPTTGPSPAASGTSGAGDLEGQLAALKQAEASDSERFGSIRSEVDTANANSTALRSKVDELQSDLALATQAGSTDHRWLVSMTIAEMVLAAVTIFLAFYAIWEEWFHRILGPKLRFASFADFRPGHDENANHFWFHLVVEARKGHNWYPPFPAKNCSVVIYGFKKRRIGGAEFSEPYFPVKPTLGWAPQKNPPLPEGIEIPSGREHALDFLVLMIGGLNAPPANLHLQPVYRPWIPAELDRSARVSPGEEARFHLRAYADNASPADCIVEVCFQNAWDGTANTLMDHLSLRFAPDAIPA